MDEKKANWASHVTALSLALVVLAGPVRYILDVSENFYLLAIVMLIGVAFVKAFMSKHKIVTNKFVIRYYLMFYLLFGWLLLSVLWTESSTHYFNDMFLIAALMGLMLLMAFVVDRFVCELFLKYTLALSSFVVLIILWDVGFTIATPGYGSFVHGFYLSSGTAIGLGFLISISGTIMANKNHFRWGLVSLLFIFALSITLARGALLFSIGIALMLIVFSLKSQTGRKAIIKTRLYRYLIFVMPGALAAFVLAMQVDRTRARIMRMLDPLGELEAGGRGQIWLNALNRISENPTLGYGLGGLDQGYAHNLFLQVWLDGGIFAFVLLSLLLAYPIIHLFLKKKYLASFNQIIASYLACYIFLILEYSKSYNFYTARSLFVFGFLFLVQIIYQQQKWKSFNGRKESEIAHSGIKVVAQK